MTTLPEAWAEYEAANRRSVDAYHELPTTDIRALIDLAIDTIDRPFTAKDVRAGVPRHLSNGVLNAHIAKLVDAGVLKPVTAIRTNGRLVHVYDFTPEAVAS